MRNAKPATDNPCDVAILLFPDFSTQCLANTVEPLRAANTLSRRRLYRWQHLSLDGAPVASSSGLPVTPRARLSEHPGGGMLMVMPSYAQEKSATPACARALRAARGRFTRLIGLDTGSWLLAAAGLLDGRRATIHWDELERFAETFPDVQVSAARVVEDGDVLSCGGGVTALELMLSLIAAQHGAMLALEVGALFMYGERAPATDLEIAPPPAQLVAAAVALMRRNIERPLPIAGIAGSLGLGMRALEQHFARAGSPSPRAVYRALRLSAARRLVETTAASVSEIATRCGYENPSALTRAFRAEHGTTPQALRRARDMRSRK